MKFNILYIDPPWDLKILSRQVRPNQTKLPYKTMTLDDIKNMPLNKIIADDFCHCFLWTTHKYIEEALEFIKFWGFKKNCVFNWDKLHGFCPMGFIWSNEFCVYGQLKGKWKQLNQLGIKTSFTAPRGKHSEKPEEMETIIKKACGSNIPKIEIFAREIKTGWYSIGNEIDGLDIYDSIEMIANKPDDFKQNIIKEKTLFDN